MKRIFTIAFLVLIFVCNLKSQDTNKGKWTNFLNPKIGFTYQNNSKAGSEESNVQWLANLVAKSSFDAVHWQISGSLFLNYGQIHKSGVFPVKNQDDIILTITPSYTLDHLSETRLFLETTFETDLRPGTIDTQKTKFLDPGFLNQSLFLGQKKKAENKDSKMKFEITYGLGLAYQVVLTDQFRYGLNNVSVKSGLEGLKQTTLEAGMSGLIETNYTRELVSDLTFAFGLKTILFSKGEFWKDAEKTRVSMLLVTSVKYKFISLDYSNRTLYDASISSVRQMNSTLLVSFNWVL